MTVKSKIRTSDLSKAIMAQLEEYSREVVTSMNEVGARLSVESMKELRIASAQTFAKKSKRKRTGKYAKGWTVKTMEFLNTPNRYTIYNKDRYQLAHLLEYGHSNRDGTRTEGTPHIKPVEEKLVAAYIKQVEEAIKG